VEPEHDGPTVELRFDLVLNILGADQDATEIAGQTGSLAAPHANWDGSTQGSDVEPSRPRLNGRIGPALARTARLNGRMGPVLARSY
jgi:hypothetical protein